MAYDFMTWLKDSFVRNPLDVTDSTGELWRDVLSGRGFVPYAYNKLFGKDEASSDQEVNAPSESGSLSNVDDYEDTMDPVGYLEGLFSSVGKENTANRLFNSTEAALNREFQASEAQKNRDFQEYMSNTSFQRATADLQQAGLNPALAFTNLTGATTPAGAAGSGSAASYQVGGGDSASSIINAIGNVLSAVGMMMPSSVFQKVVRGFRP